MKNKVGLGILVMIMFALTVACSSDKKDELEKVEVDGSGVEMVFKEFNDDGEAVVTLSNHMDANLDEFKAEAYWLDKDGNYIIGFMDKPDYFPFNEKQNDLVPTGSKLEYTTMIDMDMAPEGTEAVEMKITYARFDDKTEWEPEVN